jgi:FAD synthetase
MPIKTARSVAADIKEINKIIDEAKRYLEERKYYLAEEKSETSLASVAYSEGLLDALRMLGLIEFSW